MSLLLYGLAVLTVFLFAVWVQAIVITDKHRDTTATYPLFAVRDSLVRAVVFEGVARDDPWLNALYEQVNMILAGSHVVSGPGNGWSHAAALGRKLGQAASDFEEPSPLPHGHPIPAPVAKILPEIDRSLTQLIRQHRGLQILINEERRTRNKERRRLAKNFKASLPSPGTHGFACA